MEGRWGSKLREVEKKDSSSGITWNFWKGLEKSSSRRGVERVELSLEAFISVFAMAIFVLPKRSFETCLRSFSVISIIPSQSEYA